ncbi:MAG: hypothetical protein FWF90_17405 [Promicromonosporaceae bacterium]|nr:hypothetical protein [Promicromonosporaceae bacterium]
MGFRNPLTLAATTAAAMVAAAAADDVVASTLAAALADQGDQTSAALAQLADSLGAIDFADLHGVVLAQQIAGAVIAGPQIIGGVITGATIQTDAEDVGTGSGIRMSGSTLQTWSPDRTTRLDETDLICSSSPVIGSGNAAEAILAQGTLTFRKRNTAGTADVAGCTYHSAGVKVAAALPSWQIDGMAESLSGHIVHGSLGVIDAAGGITPGDIQADGQVRCASVAATGKVTGNNIHSGTVVVTPNASGNVAFVFGYTFPAIPNVVVGFGDAAGTATSTGGMVSVVQSTITTTQCTLLIRNGDGTVATGAHRINWLAHVN